MPPKNPADRRKLSQAFEAKRKAEGFRKITARLDPVATARLDAFRAAAGGVDAAINMALKAWNGPGAPKLEGGGVSARRGYSISEITEMRELVRKLMTKHHLNSDGSYAFSYSTGTSAEVEDQLRTYMQSGTSLAELEAKVGRSAQ